MSRSVDLDLVARARAGSREACAALWNAHRRFVGGVLFAHMPADADLEDLCQEVAMRMCRGLGRLADPAKFLGWLRSIAIHVAVSDARRGRLRNRVVGLAPDELEASPQDESGSLDDVLALVRTLPADYREPLVLKAIDGLSQREVAVALDLPETTVETRLARARRMLRELVAARENAPVPMRPEKIRYLR